MTDVSAHSASETINVTDRYHRRLKSPQIFTLVVIKLAIKMVVAMLGTHPRRVDVVVSISSSKKLEQIGDESRHLPFISSHLSKSDPNITSLGILFVVVFFLSRKIVLKLSRFVHLLEGWGNASTSF